MAARRLRTVGIIPARLAAQRLPRKPLASLGGVPLVVQVMRQVQRSRGLDAVVVATDSTEVADAVSTHGGRALMTSELHASGTDRVAEAAKMLDADLVVNVQGDEPFVSPVDVERVADALRREPGTAVTLMTPITSAEEWRDTDTVKVVGSDDGHALYFSRAPIPHPREGLRRTVAGSAAAPTGASRHLGLYGYSREVLELWTGLPVHPLERIESLEQLRALAAGIRFRLLLATSAVRGVDTAEDLAQAQARVAALGEGAFPGRDAVG